MLYHECINSSFVFVVSGYRFSDEPRLWHGNPKAQQKRMTLRKCGLL